MALQIVRIDNKGTTPIILVNNGDKYEVPVDGSKIVPYECAASAYGDPRARDTGRDRGRTDIYNAVRGGFNFNLGFDDAAAWDEKRPKFEAFDVNTGEQIWFVIDDPQGLKASEISDGYVAPSSTNTDAALVSQQLAAMQAQIAQLTTALALSQNSASGVDIGAPTVVAAGAGADPSDIADAITAGEAAVAVSDQAAGSKSGAVAAAAPTNELPPLPAKSAPVKADGPKSVK